jgi:hypothetical protein
MRITIKMEVTEELEALQVECGSGLARESGGSANIIVE